jgi:hypothetical protein
MTSNDSRSPFERLKEYYDHEELVCRECGFEDEEGTWEAETDGGNIVYHHTCPKCDTVREHRIELSDNESGAEYLEEHQ